MCYITFFHSKVTSYNDVSFILFKVSYKKIVTVPKVGFYGLILTFY